MSHNTRVFWAAIGLLSLFAISACERTAPQRPAPPPPQVSVSQVITKDVVDWDEYPGRLEAVDLVEVRARVGGFIMQTPFEEGAMVKAGDTLFVLDPRPFQATLDSAKADHMAAKAQAELARLEFTRVEKLAPTRAVSEQEVDTRRQQALAAEAQVAAALAKVQAAQLDLDFTTVKAPIAGRIGRKLVSTGNLITGGSGSATLLTTIASIDPVYCYVDVDERTVQRYTRLAVENNRTSARDARIPAYIGLATEAGFPHQGTIDFVDNRINPNTGTLQARAVVPNPRQLLQPGYFARLRVPARNSTRVVLISDTAIGIDQTQKYVLVLNDKNQAEYRSITTGKIFDGLRAVEGLKEGEKVIVTGLMRVRPGVTVTATEIPMPVRVSTTEALSGSADQNPPSDPAKMPPSIPRTPPSSPPSTSPQ